VNFDAARSLLAYLATASRADPHKQARNRLIFAENGLKKRLLG
jgi:hypothetical protein